MGRLIDENEVLKILCRELCHPGASCPDGYCAEIREKLKDVPTAQNEFYGIEDIEEVWKFYAEEYDTNLTTNARQLKEAMCVGYEKGKQDAEQRLCDGYDLKNLSVFGIYCPNCGIKMEGK